MASSRSISREDEEEYLQLQLRCEAYDIKYNGKSMPTGQVIVKGRIIHDYHTRLQSTIDSLSTTSGHALTTINSTAKVGINKEAVRGKEGFKLDIRFNEID